MNVMELRQLAGDRVSDTRALLAAGRWSGAYYLAGYAVECGLKACVLGHILRTGVIFQNRKFGEQCWTHDLQQLVVLAGLKAAHDRERSASPDFRFNWEIVAAWTSESRYEQKTRAEAEWLAGAVTDPTHGVLTWVMTHW
ncbi:MAG: hypothetical protein ACRC7O_08020 [Fimbriiglobus sp.]